MKRYNMITTKHPIIFNTPKRLIEVSSWITHVPFAFFLISILKPKVAVELGVFSGQSYSAFCQAVRTLKLDTRCYGIDTWKGDIQLGEYGEEVYAGFSNYNQKEYGEFSQLLRMTFNEALNHFKDGSIDLLHIDGFHTYEEVKSDFESWLPKVSPSGVIVFHDTFIKDLDFGVWKLWEEISRKYPSFEFMHGYGLGVAAIGKEVNKDFIEFLREANSSGYISKLFNSLGQLAFSEARINKLNERINKLNDDYNDYKTMVSNSFEWKSGLMLNKLVDFIAPNNILRRKALVRIARIGAMVSNKSAGLPQIDKNTDDAIPEVNREYYLDTIRSLETMPLPPFENGKRKCAIFVMVKNESVFLPIWLKYYSRYIDGKDIYVFDHRSIDGSVQNCLKNYKFNVIQLDYPLSFDHVWFKFVADTVQKKLIDHYEYVIFTDVDEIILPDVNKYRGLDDYIQKLDKNYVRCIGYELIHVPHKEKPYDASESVLSQRRFWYYTHWYNKTLISNQPLNWEIGFHEVPNLESDFDRDLMLIHLHKLDFDLCWKNSFERARLKWPLEDIINNRGWQNRLTDIDKFRDYYEGWPDNFKIEEIPEELRKSNIF
jgi:Methyltransferase domain/Glycosyl transferase family 2